MEENKDTDFCLSDQLAIDRTNLGNKRTLFSSIRTSIGLFGVSAALLKLFQHNILHMIGHLFSLISVFVLIYGVRLYRYYDKYLNRISQKHKHILKESDKNTKAS